MSIPTCKLCKTPGLPGAKFCGACGTPYGDAAAEPTGGGEGLFGASAAAGGDEDLDDLFSSLPDAPGAQAGAATQLFMEAVSEEANPTGDLDDLFASGGDSGTGPPMAPAGQAGGEEVGELDDLFGPDLANLSAGGAVDGPRAQAPGMVTNILQPDQEGQDLGNLFGEGAVDPDQLFAPTGQTGLQGAVTAATLHAVDAGADADMDDLFGSGSVPSLEAPSPAPVTAESDELQGLFASAAPEPTPMGTPDDDLDDLFASGTPDASAEAGVEDLFASGTATGAMPVASGQGGLDDLFASGSGGALEGGPTSTGPVVEMSTGGGDLDDLFESMDPSADDLSIQDFAPSEPGSGTGSQQTVDLAADALFAGEGAAGGSGDGQFDDLFGSPAMEPDVSMPAFAAPPGPAASDGTIDVSASLGDIPPRQEPEDQLDDLFAAPRSGDEPSVDSIDTYQPSTGGSISGLPSDDIAAGQVQSLMDEGQENAPGIPGLEAGDLLEEAHRVADAGGRPTYDDDDGTADLDIAEDEPGSPRPAERRRPRRKPRFYALPPQPGNIAKLARLGGLLAASTLLAAAIRLHPEGAALPLAVLAPCVALGGGVVSLFVYAATKVKMPMTVLSRGLALAAVGLVVGQVVPGTLGAGAEAWPMLLALGFAVGTVLELDVLFLSLRLSLAIVGVYSSMSLVMGLVRQTPYLELIDRAVLKAPGLQEHLPPDQVALALKAFDPLFVAANFFLPAVLVLAVLQSLRDMTRRWWGLAFTRLATAGIAGLAVYWNLQQYRAGNVRNLLTLAGLE